ncbi:hypothetical protein B296_00037255 [Ensete ventricosum]|uniref:Uncharacterized protein n=1 Tax=Ensete ventricosum TaxID=4639 RepID=A0A426XC41_ENSVE|nr:hypothetical protein B296_00037255 [Ensete ventricosum]
MVGSPLRASHCQRLSPAVSIGTANAGCCTCGLLPLQVVIAPCGLALAAIGRPLMGWLWPQPTAPLRAGPGRGWPALHGGYCGCPPLLLTSFAVKIQQKCVE